MAAAGKKPMEIDHESPPSYTDLQARARAVGRTAVSAMRSGSVASAAAAVDGAEALSGSLQSEMGSKPLPARRVSSLMRQAAMGNSKSFGSSFRRADKGKDEVAQTQQTFHVMSGMAAARSPSDDPAKMALMDRAATAFLQASHAARVPTGDVGHSDVSGTVQHPTRAGSGMFGSSGAGHGMADRARADFALKHKDSFGSGPESGPVDLVTGAVVGHTRVMSAPAEAKDQRRTRVATASRMGRQMHDREALKRVARGRTGSRLTVKQQSKSALWKRAKHVTRDPSPPRR